MEDYGWRGCIEGIELEINQIHQRVTVHGHYIQLYDAMSLSSIEIGHAGTISGTIPKLVGGMRLAKELTDLFNKAFIKQHSLFTKLQEEISKTLSQIDLPHPPSSSLVDIETSPEKITDIIEGVIYETRVSNSIQMLDMKDSICQQQVKANLRQIYIAVTSFVDVKLVLFRCAQEIVDCYESAIKALAEEKGVLDSGIKYHLAVQSEFEAVFNHKLFNTEEEHDILNKVRMTWGATVLHGNASQEIIEKDLRRAAREVQFSSQYKYMSLQIGAASVLLLWTISECLNNESSSAKIWNDPTFAIFMCIGDFLLLQFMWGVSMFVWKKAGIDFIQLLSLRHTELAESRTPALLVIQSATRFALLFLIVFIIFSKLVRLSMKGYISIAYAHLIPVLLGIFALYHILVPFSSRKTWLNMLFRVLVAPYYSVNFRDGYVGDILTSLVRVLVPCAFSALYLVISIYAWLFNDLKWTITTSDKWWTDNATFHFILIPILTIYPLWIRLVQCLRRSVETSQRWPHMVNGLKYTSAIIVISLATFQPTVRKNSLWITSFVGATLFQFTWDIFQDWGIITINHNTDGSILPWAFTMRSKRLLGPVWLYYCVMIFNLVLRFAWTLTLLPSPTANDGPSLYAVLVSHIGPIVAAAEIIRRMIWGFFRLEWEQLEILQKMQPQQSKLDSEDHSKDMTKMHVDTFAKGRVSSSSLSSLNRQPGDWTQHLPSAWIETINWLITGESWPSKVRFLESIVFASVVAYIVAYSALNVQN